MRNSIHIISPDEEKPSDIRSVTYLTPAEAEGELVEFEAPGTMGQDVYRIEDINPEEKKTVLTNIHTGAEYIADDGFLPPGWNRFSTPRIGFTYETSWKEHMNGRGEWVKVTPETGHARYPEFYEGHEKTRTVSKTYRYTPPGVKAFEIRLYEGEPHIFSHKDIEDIDGAEFVFDQITPNPPGFEVLGHAYINSDWEIVYYNINHGFKDDDYTSYYQSPLKDDRNMVKQSI